MKKYIEYWTLLIFFFLFKLLGLKISSFLGGVMFLAYGTFSKRNKIVKKNLSKVFPNLTLHEKNKIIKDMWFHFGRVIGEYPNLNKLTIGKDNEIAIENESNLLNPLNQYPNCLFFSAHIGNWELTSHLLTEKGFKIHFIYRAPNNELVDNLLKKIRIGYGVGLIKKGNEGAKQCLKILNNDGGHIGMLIDQKMNDGIKTNFFNQKVMSPSAIAKFSLKYKCPIIPAVCIREKSTNFKISYLKPLTPSKIRKIGNETEIMNHLNRIVEEWIRLNPEQWIWFHNRWND